MEEICAGRVAVVTGAGRGIGREHALAFAKAGAKVVVNDVGAEVDGTATSESPADDVVRKIRDEGGHAITHSADISGEAGAESLIATALAEFGQLDILVNNAGILRDRMLVNMSYDEWDAVMRVHLRGTFGPTHFAARHWRNLSKEGKPVSGRVVNTSSPSGLYGNVGQSNYGAAKAGIASFTIITSMELARYGVTVNAIAPVAYTRMTAPLGGSTERTAEQISPLVVWLGSERSGGVTGRVFNVAGPTISVADGWAAGTPIETDGVWDPWELDELVPQMVSDSQPNPDMSGRPRAG